MRRFAQKTASEGRLERLERLAHARLQELFARAETPSLGALSGRVRGSILAGPGAFSLRPVRGALNSPLWPWRGKRFDGLRGEGVNEFGPLGCECLPFRMQSGECFDDRRPCVVLDYDLPANPSGQRGKRYEIRRLSEDLFLSRALRREDEGYRLICFYGLEKITRG